MRRQHRKDIAVSVIIGILVTFLPCWEWDGAQAAGAAALSFLVWVVMEWTERREDHA